MTKVEFRFQSMISRHEDEYNKLDLSLKEAFSRREKSDQAYRDWQLAAKRFREYSSEVDRMVDACLTQDISDHSDLREFAFCFIQCDPYYHRSGYVMEKLLRKIKALSLSDLEKRLLRELLIRRIDTKARRNFRDICRLIPKIETDALKDKVVSRIRSDDPSVKYRAGFAMRYFKAQ